MKFFALALFVLMVYVVGIHANCAETDCEKLPEDLICVIHNGCHEDLFNECMFRRMQQCRDSSVGLASYAGGSCAKLNIPTEQMCVNSKDPVQ